MRIVLDLESDGDPIRGTISSVRQEHEAFYGWLQLAQALEVARASGRESSVTIAPECGA